MDRDAKMTNRSIVLLVSAAIPVLLGRTQPCSVVLAFPLQRQVTNRNAAKVATRMKQSLFLLGALLDDDEHDDHEGSEHHVHFTRRSLLRSSGLACFGINTGWMSSIVPPAFAKDDGRAVVLPDRLQSNSLIPPMYGMDGPDVYYPSWLTGTWKVVSVTTDVQAPCGMAMFGGNATFRMAREEIGPAHALVYESRFLPLNNDNVEDIPTPCIADREYNVKSIAKVALGPNSIVDVSLATPNHFACLVIPPSPKQSTTSASTSTVNSPSNLLNVDILVLQRRQEPLDNVHFACSEVVREIITAVNPASSSSSSSSSPSSRQTPEQQASTVFKEVETISLYTATFDDSGNGDISTVHCQQRSASFLVPRREDPRSIAMWQATEGKPVDVRCYDVTYTRQV